MSAAPSLRAPFPWFGGKSRAASLVWEALGNPPNFVEPFFGSGAVLLARPHPPRTETVNDASKFLANFWRALALNPDAVADACDWPVNECVPAGTMIATPTGAVPVELVVPGMIVWGEAQGRRVPTKVLAIKQDYADEFVRVGGLRVTGNHPVWTQERGYVQASDLTAGEHVRIFDWPATETDLRVLYDINDKSTVGGVRPERSPDRETAVRRSDVPRSSAPQRAPVEGCDGQGADAPGLLAAVAPAVGSAPCSLGAGGGLRGGLAGAGAVLDCSAPTGGGPRESHGRWRGDAGLRADARNAGEVVRDAEGREVSSGSARRDAGQATQRVRSAPHRGGFDGQAPHPGDASADCTGGDRARGAAEHDRGVRDVSTGRSADGRTPPEDRCDNHESEAGGLRRDGRLVSVDHSGGSRAGGQRGVGLSGDPQGLPLQRESLPTRVAVHNFETTTGNYFADNVLVHNCDLHARHRWLVARLPELAALLDSDPEAHDAKVAGWWVWGACAWIGTGWCDEDGKECGAQVRHLSTAGQGIHRRLPQQLPHLGGNHDSGRGVRSGRARDDLRAYLGALSARLRGVRVACGDWSRVCTDSVTWRHGVTGVFLDPPYAEGAQQYAAGGTGTGLSAEVRAWAIEAGKRRDMRVVLAGLEGEHDMPAGWRCVPWKARGGYGGQRDDGTVNENRHRERLWLSPHCEGARQLSLLGGAS